MLTINGVNEYDGQFRGSSDPWPHLLVQQRISDPGGQIGSQSPSIADMTSLDFHIDARLLYDNRTLTAGYNPSLHASQYNIYYTLQNLNTASPGYGDFLWFGTALYDDREDVTGRHVMVDEFSQKLIYSIGIAPFTSEHIADGNWIPVNGDLLPHMKAALDTAWSEGILLDSQDYADYRIGGVNLGWEMPGLNNASLQIRNYNVVANLSAPGDANEDGSVDVLDLGILATNYDTGSGFGWGDGDFSGDGFVDVSDLGILATHYGETASVASVPEPGTLSLLATCGLMLLGLGTRRRKR